MEELRAESQQSLESSGTIGRSKGASISSSQQQISVTVVTEFVRWNEEAVSRCTLFSSQVYKSSILKLPYHLSFKGSVSIFLNCYTSFSFMPSTNIIIYSSNLRW